MGANLIPTVRNFSITSDFVGDTHEVDDGCVPPPKRGGSGFLTAGPRPDGYRGELRKSL